MTTPTLRTQFQHLAQDGDPLAIGVQLSESAESGFGRVRIGVVTVVDELDAVDGFDLQARFGERRSGETGGACLEGKSKDTTGRDGDPPPRKAATSPRVPGP